MNNLSTIRRMTEFLHKELVINNDRTIICSDGQIDTDCCIYLKYPRMVFLNNITAYVEYNAVKLVYLNNDGRGVTFNHDVSEEELFQQSLLDDTISIHEVDKIKDIYTYIMENNLW